MKVVIDGPWCEGDECDPDYGCLECDYSGYQQIEVVAPAPPSEGFFVRLLVSKYEGNHPEYYGDEAIFVVVAGEIPTDGAGEECLPLHEGGWAPAKEFRLYHFTGGEFYTTRSGRTLRDLRPDVLLALGKEDEKFLPLEQFLEKYCPR